MLKKIKKKKQQLANIPSAFDEAIISWLAPEFIRYERGKIWKVLAVAAVLAAAVLGVLYNAWTFSLAVVIFAIVYYLLNREHPKDIQISLSNVGIKAGKRRYPFGKIKSFWIIYDPPFAKTLNIRVEGDFVSDITLQLNEQSPADVREFLMEKIPEQEGQQEPISDIFLRLFKI